MTYGYSDDLRKAALACYDRGGCTQAMASDVFGIGLKTFSNWIRLRKGGDVSRRSSQKPKGALKLEECKLREYIARHPDQYLHEIAAQFGVHPTSIHYACKRSGITRKKNGTIL